jgi:hypothetical protein
MHDIDLNNEAQLDAHFAALEARMSPEEKNDARVDAEHSTANFTYLKKKKSKVVAPFTLMAISVHNMLCDTVIDKLKTDIKE